MRDIDYRIAELAKPYLNTRKNDIHTEKSCEFAITLLASEPGDPEIVIPAILCHDMGWIKLNEDQQSKAFNPKGHDPELLRIHEVEGVKLAREVLNQVQYNPQQTEEILVIIEGHDSRLTALSDNDKLVKDADKLFRFSQVAVEGIIERFEFEINRYLKHLRAQIEPWFFTDTAKKLAVEELAKTMRILDA